jgi:NADH-quinone oxidoreductase subunit J
MTIVLGTIAVMSGLMVITEKNTIHSVFYLVMSFVNSALMLIIWGVDYLGLLIIIVYVGAIAILFLFVVMMINVRVEETNRTRYVPIGIIISIALIMEVYLQYPQQAQVEEQIGYKINGGETNLTMMGEMIYTWELVMYGSLVLLVAMIGAVVLTMSHTEGVKRQDIYRKWEA